MVAVAPSEADFDKTLGWFVWVVPFEVMSLLEHDCLTGAETDRENFPGPPIRR